MRGILSGGRLARSSPTPASPTRPPRLLRTHRPGPSHTLGSPTRIPSPIGSSASTASTGTGLFRALELLRVRPWGYGVPLAGKVHGKVNINTVQDPRVLLALLDPAAVAGTNNQFNTGDVYFNSNLGS